MCPIHDTFTSNLFRRCQNTWGSRIILILGQKENIVVFEDWFGTKFIKLVMDIHYSTLLYKGAFGPLVRKILIFFSPNIWALSYKLHTLCKTPFTTTASFAEVYLGMNIYWTSHPSLWNSIILIMPRCPYRLEMWW